MPSPRPEAEACIRHCLEIKMRGAEDLRSYVTSLESRLARYGEALERAAKDYRGVAEACKKYQFESSFAEAIETADYLDSILQDQEEV